MTYNFTTHALLRVSLGPEQPRTMPDMIRLAIAAAEEDRKRSRALTAWSAADITEDVVGFDLYARILEILDATPAERPDIITIPEPPPTDLARMLTVAADELERISAPARQSDPVAVYIRNEALQAIARSFRNEAARISGPPEDASWPVCAWCAKPIRPGLATVRNPGNLLARDMDTYHAECWDRKLRAERNEPTC